MIIWSYYKANYRRDYPPGSRTLGDFLFWIFQFGIYKIRLIIKFLNGKCQLMMKIYPARRIARLLLVMILMNQYKKAQLIIRNLT